MNDSDALRVSAKNGNETPRRVTYVFRSRDNNGRSKQWTVEGRKQKTD